MAAREDAKTPKDGTESSEVGFWREHGWDHQHRSAAEISRCFGFPDSFSPAHSHMGFYFENSVSPTKNIPFLSGLSPFLVAKELTESKPQQICATQEFHMRPLLSSVLGPLLVHCLHFSKDGLCSLFCFVRVMTATVSAFMIPRYTGSERNWPLGFDTTEERSCILEACHRHGIVFGSPKSTGVEVQLLRHISEFFSPSFPLNSEVSYSMI